jgi:hypothetical protein
MFQSSNRRYRNISFHSREESFDAASAPGLAGNREHQPHFQVRAHLFQMLGCEVAPIVRVENVRGAAHDPARVLFAPDSLTQSQRCVQRGWVFER